MNRKGLGDRKYKGDVHTKRSPVLPARGNTVTILVENKKIQLVVMAHDMGCIKLAVFLLALSHQMRIHLRYQEEGQAGASGPQEDLHQCCLHAG